MQTDPFFHTRTGGTFWGFCTCGFYAPPIECASAETTTMMGACFCKLPLMTPKHGFDIEPASFKPYSALLKVDHYLMKLFQQYTISRDLIIGMDDACHLKRYA